MGQRVETFAFKTSLQDNFLRKKGSCMMRFSPNTKNKVGYENIDNDGKWDYVECRGFLNFNVQRGSFYKRNWFPENQEELVLGLFMLNDPIAPDDYILTRNCETISPWGSCLFKVAKIFDQGKYRVLKREVFLRPQTDNELYRLFNRLIGVTDGN